MGIVGRITWTSLLVRMLLIAAGSASLGTTQLVSGQVEIGPRSKPAPKTTRKAKPDRPPASKSTDTFDLNDYWLKSLDIDLGSGVNLEMVLVREGTFVMGAMNGESDERPIHRVTISEPYYIGKYEVTQEQWAVVMGQDPNSTSGKMLPAVGMTWDEVQEFLWALKVRTDGEWRLPTEAEWEYACRAGTTGDYAGNLDELAWYTENSTGSHPVGQKRPNAWGLYDMHGNVWEWCQDSYGPYLAVNQMDPVGASEDKRRIIRGGGWPDYPSSCRSARRGKAWPSKVENGFNYAKSHIGFRVALPTGVGR